MINTFHVPIMGFLQSQGVESGMEKLWRKLREVAVGPTKSLIHPQAWNADFEALAEFIFRNGGPKTTVYVYAYSWGCGHGAVALANALNKRGIQIPKMVLCDPVFYSWWRVYRGMFHASLNPPIVLPANVWAVHSFFQRQNTPQGTAIVLKNKVGINNDPVELHCNHHYADDDPLFHEQVLIVARNAPEKP